MKKLFFVFLFVTFFNPIQAQDSLLCHSISTSLVRFERNSQTINNPLVMKLLLGVEYQRIINDFKVGIKYEHGSNTIKDWSSYKSLGGINGNGLLKEDNVYFTGNYTFLKFYKSKLVFNAGLSLYYSHSNYSGDFRDWWAIIPDYSSFTYNLFGLAASFDMTYYPIKRLFVSLNTCKTMGWGRVYNAKHNHYSNTNGWMLTFPELRLGVRF